jgi:hypothetical protein
MDAACAALASPRSGGRPGRVDPRAVVDAILSLLRTPLAL